MKNSNSNISSKEKQNSENNTNQELTSKSLNEISTKEKSSKKVNKFDKTTQSFSPMVNHNKWKTYSKYSELIIDTRNTPLKDFTQKFDFVKYRHEKYQKRK